MPESRRLAGRYRLIEPVGRGGIGTGIGMVWRAYDETLHREVAVKEILPPDGVDEGELAAVRERSLREARAAAALQHPGIIAIYDVLEADGRPWIVMQLIHGWSLDQVVRTEGPLPVDRVARIGLGLLDALECAHARGILHRDVTPRNVLLTRDGARVVLTDFGIAAVAGATALTRTGMLVGSPGYMAPERLGGLPPGPAADLWSLGACLYYAVEGQLAFRGEEAAVLIGAVLTRDPEPPRRAGPLAPALMGLLARDPAARWDPRRVRAVLEQVAAAPYEQPAASAAPMSAAAPRPVKRPPRSGGSKATIAFAVVLGIAAAAYLGYNELGIGRPADRFTSMPDVCEVATGARLENWVPYAEPRSRWRAERKVRLCMWSSGYDATSEQHAYLALTATRYERSGSRSGSEAAQETFAATGGRNPDSLPWTDEPGVGDEAVKYVNQSTGQVRLHFRTGNLIVQIAYNRESPDTASSTADDIAAEILAELNSL